MATGRTRAVARARTPVVTARQALAWRRELARWRYEAGMASVAGIAAALGVCERTVRQWAADGGWLRRPGIRIGAGDEAEADGGQPAADVVPADVGSAPAALVARLTRICAASVAALEDAGRIAGETDIAALGALTRTLDKLIELGGGTDAATREEPDAVDLDARCDELARRLAALWGWDEGGAG